MGAKTKDEILCTKELKNLGVDIHIATEDGSLGYKGLVSTLLKNKLSSVVCRLSSVVYACGPKGMLKEIALLSKEHKIPCQVSFEQFMGCGIGICNSCVIRTKQGYKRVCKDGPVFSSEEIDWERRNIRKPNLSVKLGSIKLQNPVILASGTCGFGEEIAEFIDLNKVGALITKTITLKPREGNPPPRIAEVEGGIINSIGLENPGIEVFIKEKLPFLRKLKIPFFVSISGETEDEFVELARILDKEKGISAIELNLSCPNLKQGKNLFGQDPKTTYQIIKKVKETTSIPIIAKLTPQVKDITEIALPARKQIVILSL